MSHQLLLQVSRQLLQAVRCFVFFCSQMADFTLFCYLCVLFFKGPEKKKKSFLRESLREDGPFGQTESLLLKVKYFKGAQ